MLIYNDSKIEGIFNSYLINFRFDTKYSKYELELKDIKKFYKIYQFYYVTI